MHAGAHSLNAFGYDAVPGIQPARDDPQVIDAVLHSYGSNVDFVVGTDDSHLVAALQFRNGRCRNCRAPGWIRITARTLP